MFHTVFPHIFSAKISVYDQNASTSRILEPSPQGLIYTSSIHKFENFPVCSESASFYCSISPPIKVSNLTTLQQSQTKLVQIL